MNDNTQWLENKHAKSDEMREIERTERMVERFIKKFQQKHAEESIQAGNAWSRK
jgi:hypothetical protein